MSRGSDCGCWWVLVVLVVAGSGWAGGDGRGREPTRENDISGVLPGTLPGLW